MSYREHASGARSNGQVDDTARKSASSQAEEEIASVLRSDVLHRRGQQEHNANPFKSPSDQQFKIPSDQQSNFLYFGLRSEPDSTGLGHLAGAISRAKAGGRALSLVQIGDSHIAGGIETPALASRLGQLEGVAVRHAEFGVVGATAINAANNPARFLSKIDRNTDLVVVSFGSNDSVEQGGAAYKAKYNQLLHEIETRAPGASILMVGPTDGAISGRPNTELPGLKSITESQRSVAATVQFGDYFDIRSRMGSIGEMKARGWMRGDNLHFTPAGYQAIGSEIATFIKSKV